MRRYINCFSLVFIALQSLGYAGIVEDLRDGFVKNFNAQVKTIEDLTKKGEGSQNKGIFKIVTREEVLIAKIPKDPT